MLSIKKNLRLESKSPPLVKKIHQLFSILQFRIEHVSVRQKITGIFALFSEVFILCSTGFGVLRVKNLTNAFLPPYHCAMSHFRQKMYSCSIIISSSSSPTFVHAQSKNA